MLRLSFHQTKAEIMVRAAATLIFDALVRSGRRAAPLSSLTENPQYGFTASATYEPIGPKFVRITDLQDASIDWDSVPYCECKDPSKYLLEPYDLLFARTGATTGKTHLVEGCPHAVFASYLIRLRPKPVALAEYLYSFFQSDSYWSQICNSKEGSAQPNVNGRKLLSISVPLVDSETQSAIRGFLKVLRERQEGLDSPLPNLPSPLEEQRRLVLQVEELAGKIEEARSLRTVASRELEAFKKSAVDAILDSSKYDAIPLGDLLSEESLNGISTRPESNGAGIEILRISAGTSREDGLVDETDVKYLPADSEKLEKYRLRQGDLLACRFNGNLGYVGRFSLYTSLRRTFQVYPDKLIRFRVREQTVLPQFVRYAMNSTWGRSQIEPLCATTAGNLGISAGQLKTVKVPVPNPKEQLRITGCLDELQAKTEALKQLQSETAAELEALMPSILSRALGGQL